MNGPSADATLCVSLSARPGKFGFTVHNAGYAALGLNYFYKPMTCRNLEEAFTGIRALNIRGCSLSMPYKVQAMALLDKIDSAAQAIGAVNTVVNDDGFLVGYNTDLLGVQTLVSAIDYKTPWLVLGAGGMARAILQAANLLGQTEVFISARESNLAASLAAEFGVSAMPWAERNSLRGVILINATPVGMVPKVDEMPVDPGTVAEAYTVFDVIASPSETMLINAARLAGVPVITGQQLAFEQACAQFKLYTGHDAPRAAMQAAAENL